MTGVLITKKGHTETQSRLWHEAEAEIGGIHLPVKELTCMEACWWFWPRGFVWGHPGSQSHYLQSLSRNDTSTKCCWCTESGATCQAWCRCKTVPVSDFCPVFWRINQAGDSRNGIHSSCHLCPLISPGMLVPGPYFCTCWSNWQLPASESFCLRLSLSSQEHMKEAGSVRELIIPRTALNQWLGAISR